MLTPLFEDLGLNGLGLEGLGLDGLGLDGLGLEGLGLGGFELDCLGFEGFSKEFNSAILALSFFSFRTSSCSIHFWMRSARRSRVVFGRGVFGEEKKKEAIFFNVKRVAGF